MKTLKILVVACAFSLSACGGGGGGGGSAPASDVSTLAGTWLGTMEDTYGAMHQLSVTIGGSGNITQILVDGSNQNLTGSITKLGTNLFGIAFSDQSEGGFFADTSRAHVAYLTDTFSFGVLQKGATSLPSYAATDIVGSWSGYSVTLKSDFSLNQIFSSTATIANNSSRTFTGSDINGAFSGSFPTTTLTYGRWMGSYTNPSSSGPVRAFLSVDKSFAATWACETGGSFPADCSFSAWNR